jgi:hypothetical protein
MHILFEEVHLLGEGNDAEVYRCLEKGTRRVFAVKVAKKLNWWEDPVVRGMRKEHVPRHLVTEAERRTNEEQKMLDDILEKEIRIFRTLKHVSHLYSLKD